MCEYTYSNGVKCQEKPLENSKYCALHISFKEGEKLLGREKLKELKLNAVAEKLKKNDFNFEGAYLYQLPITWEILDAIGMESLDGDINLSFSKIWEVIIRGSENRPLKFKNLFIYGAEIFGLYISGAEFQDIYTTSPILYEKMKEMAHKISEGSDSFKISPELVSDEDVKMLLEAGAFVNTLWIIECQGKTLHMNGLHCSNFILANSIVDGVWMNSSKLGQVVLRDVKVPGDIHLISSKIGTGKLLQPVEVGGRLYLNYSKIHSNRFAIELFRLARRLFKKEERPDDLDNAEYHFYREMAARRKWRVELAKEEAKGMGRLRGRLKILTAKLGSLVEYLLLDVTIKYGTSWKRLILIWLPMVLLVFPMLYYLTDSVPGIDSYWKAIYFSVVTATTLGYGDFHPVGIGTFFASLEAIMGTFMWALLITVLGRKYLNP